MANVDIQDTQDRRRAKHAYDHLRHLKDKGSLDRLKTRVQGFPVALRSQGLTVAVATLLKEGRPESMALADLLADWLKESNVLANTIDDETAQGVLKHSVNCSRVDYLVLQSEALAYMEHVKRLASALEKSS